VEPAANCELAERLRLALAELGRATADMETSVADLRMPLEERPLEQALREQAAELGPAAGIAIGIRGRAPALPSLVAAHAHRIACEALTNAVRHSAASRIEVRLDGDERHLHLVVQDDGEHAPSAASGRQRPAFDARPREHARREPHDRPA
jgi:signal transduction histidine kinase